MGLAELVIQADLPTSPPPISTARINARPLQEDPSKLSKSTGEEEQEEEDYHCVTPKSEESTAVKPAAAAAVLVCPPAPRKPRRRPAKRKHSSLRTAAGYFPVPDDLTLLFVPATKKVRLAG
ncbi:hypothetical protein Cni_G27823 [Canna indica]|uniref:Uncharacterized protein n=1 Tax=Canna indica TaxID=4628 RepID=A0AAQ3QNA5_9LILI|nr:hypothetical protein Cni_G27823 [Canna indica]